MSLSSKSNPRIANQNRPKAKGDHRQRIRFFPNVDGLELRSLLTTIINFDNLPSGTPLVSQYGSLGVDFQAASVLNPNPNSSPNPTFPPHSGMNVAIPSLSNNYIFGVYDTYANKTPAWSSVGAYVTSDPSYHKPVVITAFNTTGGVIGIASTTGLGTNVFLSISVPNIAYVKFSSEGFFTTDDMTFNAVPAKPDIVMDSATTTDSSTVTATYDINAASITQPLTFNIYRSASQTSYGATDLIGTDTLSASDGSDLSIGHHQVKLNLTSKSLLPDPLHEFVFVVANPGKNIVEQDYTNDTAYFQILILGAISHGLIPYPIVSDPTGSTPQWELAMQSTLEKQDKYNDVIAFNWVYDSFNTTTPGIAGIDGRKLANQIATEAMHLASAHTGDVVDLHLIGHSRGAVIVSQAAEYLQSMFVSNPSYKAVMGSYIRMTLLDPHPASNYNKQFFDVSNNLAGTIARGKVEQFQQEVNDPSVFVPSIVTYAEVYYQQTPASKLSGSESVVNLWGQGQSDDVVGISPNVPIKWYNLTSDYLADVGFIGHSEVQQYYQNTIVATGKTFS